MIHTLQTSYGISVEVANTLTYRLNERTHKYDNKMYMVANFLDKDRKRLGHLVFKVPELAGIKSITMVKYADHNDIIQYRIYFLIEAEILRTGTDTLDLFFASPEHAKQLQTRYAKAIFSLFGAEPFTARSAAKLYTTGFAPKESYMKEEYGNFNGGYYALPFLLLASVRRIDFTMDHLSEDEDHATLFTEMLSKSYYDGHKKIEKTGKSHNEASNKRCFDKEYASASRGFSVYDKYDKMMAEKYNDRPNIAQIREDSRNVTRIEMPIKSPDRRLLKSITTLKIPDDAIPLGPLPYLAREQITARLFNTEFIHRVGNFKDLKWLTRDGFDKIINKKIRTKEISKTVGNGLIKMSQAVSKRGSLKKYVDALKKYNESIRGEKIKKKDRKFPSISTFFNYKKIAMQYGLMLPTIPANRPLKELSVGLDFRNYYFEDLNWVIITYMLPYQSVAETAPELEPVKDMYEAILEFLYGLYDQYNADWNTEWEAAMIPAEEFEQ